MQNFYVPVPSKRNDGSSGERACNPALHHSIANDAPSGEQDRRWEGVKTSFVSTASPPGPGV
jgi:hypothetical protein